jgi:plasmid stabilization system protein ParE
VNLIDDIEIEIFEHTGETDTAVAAGQALRAAFDALAHLLGLPPQLFTDAILDTP